MIKLPDGTKLDKRETIVKKFEQWDQSVYSFARDVFPHLLKEEVPDFHKEIYDLLPNVSHLAVEAFRGAAKSTICLVIYPIWFALFRRTGDITLLSKSEDFTINEIVRRIKHEFEHNKVILSICGSLKTDKWSERFFVLANGVAFEAGGVGGQLRGGRRGLVALDDLEDEESAMSEDQREKLKRRIYKELMPKLVKGGQMIYMGTPVHQFCVLHQIIQEENNGWEKRIYPAYKRRCEKEGHEQWKAVFPHQRLQEEKSRMGSTFFATEYLCNPIAEETMPIKSHQIKYFEVSPANASMVISVDPAYSEDQKSDFKVAVCVVYDENGNRFLEDYIRTHAPVGEFIDMFLNLYLKYKANVTALGVPSGGSEKEFYRSVVRRAEERKLCPPLTELKNVFTRGGTQISYRNKRQRIVAALQPLFEAGKYFVKRHMTDVIEELLTIGQSRYDDTVDAMTYAESLIQPVYFETSEWDEGWDIEENLDFIKQADYAINYG